MAVISPKLTYEDLLETPDDGKRYEIIDGELFVSTSRLLAHPRAAWNLTQFFHDAEEARLGTGFAAPVDVVFDQFNVTVPDLIFILAERSHIMTEANIQGPPDIIVEVLSPSTRRRDIGIKKQLYARFGTPYYCIVDASAKTVQPFRLAGEIYETLALLTEQDTLTCPLLPGISMPVAALFK